MIDRDMDMTAVAPGAVEGTGGAVDVDRHGAGAMAAGGREHQLPRRLRILINAPSAAIPGNPGAAVKEPARVEVGNGCPAARAS